jgi:serine/threonine protein kinase
MAPEVINSTTYTEKADVYSYGIILWEIYARAIPYKDMNPMQVRELLSLLCLLCFEYRGHSDLSMRTYDPHSQTAEI